MKKTVQVNIGGCAFNIDEESYSIIEDYLAGLKRYYNGNLDGKEIVEDIEERMAELLLERCETGNVVSAADARYAIGVLGTPAAIVEESTSDKSKSSEKPKTRLYRNPVGNMIGGVCNGLATYWNCDVTLIRLITAVLFLASFASEHLVLVIPVMYILCWIAMPNADTVQKQCELRGEQLSAAGIEQRVMSGKDEPVRPSGHLAGRILGFLCGLLLFLTGLGALGTGIFVTTLPAFASINPEIANAISEACAEIGLTGLKSLGVTTAILAMLVYYIPCIIAIYYGILLMFGLKSPKWRPGLILVLIWVIALVILIPLLAIDIASLIPHM